MSNRWFRVETADPGIFEPKPWWVRYRSVEVFVPSQHGTLSFGAKWPDFDLALGLSARSYATYFGIHLNVSLGWVMLRFSPRIPRKSAKR